MAEDWEKTLLVDSERIAITDNVCNKYKTTWEDMVDGKLSSRDLEQCVIDIYEAIAKAQAQATWEAGVKKCESCADKCVSAHETATPKILETGEQVGIQKGRQAEREQIAADLAQKEWFGEKLSPNDRLKVLNYIKGKGNFPSRRLP